MTSNTDELDKELARCEQCDSYLSNRGEVVTMLPYACEHLAGPNHQFTLNIEQLTALIHQKELEARIDQATKSLKLIRHRADPDQSTTGDCVCNFALEDELAQLNNRKDK
jgi:hypothetical protein